MDDSGSRSGNQRGARQVRGRSLHDVLHDPGTGIAQQAVIPLDPSRVVLIARAILTELAFGRVHGYITPHTILLTDDGTALLVGDRVAPGATAANDLFALGMALFEAVEGYAPHPAQPLPAMTKAGLLAPLVEALTRQEAQARPEAAQALEMLDAAVTAAAEAAATAADATETTTLPQVQAAQDTSVLPTVPADPAQGSAGTAGPAPGPPPPAPGPPAYYPYEDEHPPSKRKAAVIGGAVAAVVVIAAVALGATRPWHRTDTSSSTVPGVPTASTTAAAATPSAPIPTTPSPTTSTASPTTTPTVSNPTKLVSMSLCLDAAGGPDATVRSGARVTAAACHGSPNQTWQIHTDGTIHSMADAGLCLDAAAPTGKVLNAAQVSAWTCHGGPNQDWVWNADGTVSPVANTRLCLDAAGPVPIHAGANVTAWPCNGGPNEKWAKQ